MDLGEMLILAIFKTLPASKAWGGGVFVNVAFKIEIPDLEGIAMEWVVQAPTLVLLGTGTAPADRKSKIESDVEP